MWIAILATTVGLYIVARQTRRNAHLDAEVSAARERAEAEKANLARLKAENQQAISKMRDQHRKMLARSARIKEQMDRAIKSARR